MTLDSSTVRLAAAIMAVINVGLCSLALLVAFKSATSAASIMFIIALTCAHMIVTGITVAAATSYADLKSRYHIYSKREAE